MICYPRSRVLIDPGPDLFSAVTLAAPLHAIRPTRASIRLGVQRDGDPARIGPHFPDPSAARCHFLLKPHFLLIDDPSPARAACSTFLISSFVATSRGVTTLSSTAPAPCLRLA